MQRLLNSLYVWAYMFAQSIHVEFYVLSGRFCAVRYIFCYQVYFLLSGIFCAVRYIFWYQVYFVLSGISRTWSWSQVRRMSTFLGGGRFSKSRLGSRWEAGRRSKSSTPSTLRRIRSSGRCPRIVRSIKSPCFYLYLWIFPPRPDMFYPSPPFLSARKMLWALFHRWR